MLSFSQHPITCLAIASLAAVLSSGGAGVGDASQVQPFDSDWRFHAGEINGAERPEYDDSTWLRVDVPHDWSIEGLPTLRRTSRMRPSSPVVRGEWKFSKGDDLRWKDPGLDDGAWQTVTLPATWEQTFELHRGQRVRLVPPRADRPRGLAGEGHPRSTSARSTMPTRPISTA